ncbi:MAG TPA: sugar ABC transporter ATP-binding protein [Acidimicrobiia bacterium]|jgi:simple sugar transport system ATP-binding protein/ribose transport system ATP-binding protein|nr:sugar ABC transporter ATP-binding protein [Acidimicrobiia bacterium]
MHVRIRGLSKRFGGVQALQDVDLEIARGSVHGLVGENGAGKSTLGKILAGALQPDSGELWLEGRGQVRLRTPAEALANGITIIAQELTLEPKRSIAENVLLGIEPVRLRVLDRRRLNATCARLAAEAGFDDLGKRTTRLVENLAVSERQKVEILRALARRAELIVMDEPTAALSEADAERLGHTVRSLRERGITILYVSHRLKEVLAVADTVSVLRDGRLIKTAMTGEETPASLVGAMMGRPAALAFPDKQPPPNSGRIVLSVEGLTRPPLVNGVDLAVRAGEIVGLAGLIGSGRTEIARALVGADRATAGVIELEGERLVIRSPRDAIARGIVLLPESRREQGLLLGRSVQENVTLPHLEQLSRMGVISTTTERTRAQEMTRRVGVKAAGLGARVISLSGGNQQKVLFARSLFGSPRVLVLDEPTRGVDVGAKHAIYELIAELAQQGMAVLLISSELEEVVGLSHRVLVIRHGSVVAEFQGDEVTEDAVLRAAFAAA